ncbi:MAG: thioredoxin family protein [Candidatus Hodarchaeales archaeon]
MTDTDPELQSLLKKRASQLQQKARFLETINKNGVTHVTDANIDEIIKSSPLPVLVDFSADSWCRPCQVMAPIYEELSQEFLNKVIFLKINTDHNPLASGKYRIFSVPTFMMFCNGQLTAQRAGALPKAKFKDWITAVLQRKCAN